MWETRIQRFTCVYALKAPLGERLFGEKIIAVVRAFVVVERMGVYFFSCLTEKIVLFRCEGYIPKTLQFFGFKSVSIYNTGHSALIEGFVEIQETSTFGNSRNTGTDG